MIFGINTKPVLNLKINGRLDFNNHKSKYPEETKELERRLSEEMPENWLEKSQEFIKLCNEKGETDSY